MKKFTLIMLSVLTAIFLDGQITAADNPEDAARKTALNLLKTQPFVYFSTVNEDGYPETRIVANVRFPGFTTGEVPIAADSLDTAIVTSVWRDKVTQAKKNNKASVYIIDMKTYQSVILIGTVELVEDNASKKAYYSKQLDNYYEKGPEDPNFGVLKFKTETLKVHETVKNGQRFKVK